MLDCGNCLAQLLREGVFWCESCAGRSIKLCFTFCKMTYSSSAWQSRLHPCTPYEETRACKNSQPGQEQHNLRLNTSANQQELTQVGVGRKCAPCRNRSTRSSLRGPIQCNVAPSEGSSVSTSAPLLRAHVAYISAVVTPNPNLRSRTFRALPKK